MKDNNEYQAKAYYMTLSDGGQLSLPVEFCKRFKIVPGDIISISITNANLCDWIFGKDDDLSAAAHKMRKLKKNGRGGIVDKKKK